mmetsp:Transcript_33703/g.49969  ORF Transcript_33703/g.49969 Transcript_33703/m.49969 type:complete len:103 (+) Transcript_33703:294-602(+)
MEDEQDSTQNQGINRELFKATNTKVEETKRTWIELFSQKQVSSVAILPTESSWPEEVKGLIRRDDIRSQDKHVFEWLSKKKMSWHFSRELAEATFLSDFFVL